MLPLDSFDDGVPGQTGHPALHAAGRARPAHASPGTTGAQQALLSTAADLPRTFADLLTADAVDELVSERGLRTPFLRVAKNGTTLGGPAASPPRAGSAPASPTRSATTSWSRLFADGSTMVLQALHRVWPPIIAFCQQLAAELGHPVQANAYVTPPQNQGFSNHYDVHDVFVLQIRGREALADPRPRC